MQGTRFEHKFNGKKTYVFPVKDFFLSLKMNYKVNVATAIIIVTMAIKPQNARSR